MQDERGGIRCVDERAERLRVKRQRPRDQLDVGRFVGIDVDPQEPRVRQLGHNDIA